MRKVKVTVETKIAELEIIRIENGNKLRTADIVEAAEPKEAPLHPCFEWRNTIAAHKYREYQARNLVLEVKTFNVETKKDERAYVPVTMADNSESYYQKANALTPSELELALDSFYKKMAGIGETVSQLRRFAEESGDDRLQTVIAIQSALSTANGLAKTLQ